MKIGLVGLGKMGANMRERLRGAGIEVVGYDRNAAVTDVPSLDAMVEALPAGERNVWVMVPSGDVTDAVIQQLAGLLGRRLQPAHAVDPAVDPAMSWTSNASLRMRWSTYCSTVTLAVNGVERE